MNRMRFTLREFSFWTTCTAQLHRVQGRKRARRTFFPQVSNPDDRRTEDVER